MARNTPVVRAMSFVGDLDDSFYDDERQRDVWNEAAAAGFQLLLWTALAASAILPWLPGRTGTAIALGLLISVSVASLAVLSYAKALMVDPAVSLRLRPRLFFALALYGVALVGMLADVRTLGTGFSAGFSNGALVGSVLALAALTVAFLRERRKGTTGGRK